MQIIAHRGLMHGPDHALENSPAQIEKALAAGFEVEIDVWFKNMPVEGGMLNQVRPSWWLGHDEPTYEVTESFLRRPGLWLHCKNVEALNHMTTGMHHFWHETDAHTLTSKGVVWSYPRREDTHRRLSVIVLPEWEIDPAYDIGEVLLQYFENDYINYICTDYGGAMMDAARRLRSEKLNVGMAVMSK